MTLQALHLVFGLGVHLRLSNWRQAHFGAEGVDFVLAHFAPATHRQIGIKEHRTVTYALQAADHQTLGFPQATNFTVAAFHHYAVVPMVEAFTARRLLDVGETCRTVFQQHAILEAQ